MAASVNVSKTFSKGYPHRAVRRGVTVRSQSFHLFHRFPGQDQLDDKDQYNPDQGH